MCLIHGKVPIQVACKCSQLLTPVSRLLQALMGGVRRSTGQDFPVQLAVGRIWQNQAGQVLQEPECTIAGFVGLFCFGRRHNLCPVCSSTTI